MHQFGSGSWRRERRKNQRVPGLNRRHYLRTGKPKVGFDTSEEAWVAAKDMIERGLRLGHVLDVYECDECDQWHVGNKPGNNRLADKDAIIMLSLELGDRVAGCLMVENMGRSETRYGKILTRTEAADRRRLQYHPTAPREKSRILP